MANAYVAWWAGTITLFLAPIDCLKILHRLHRLAVLRIRDWGLFDPGIRNRFIPDPGSQTHIFESLVTTFWVKSSIILCLAQIFFLSSSKIK
jgi:hypothetical protein